MKIRLCAGFGETVGQTSLRWIKDVGPRGIRQDIPWAAPVEYREKLLRELAEADMGAVLIIMGNLEYRNGDEIGTLPENWRPSAIQIADYARDVAIQAAGHLDDWYLEIGSEPNLGNHGGPLAKDPDRFGNWLQVVPRHVWEAIPDAKIISGGVCGLHKKSLRYLERALNPEIDERLIIGLHPYRTDQRADEDEDGLKDLLDHFRTIIGPRSYAVTEIGYHTAPQKTESLLPCKRKEFRFDDDDVAEFAEFELDFWQRNGAELLCWFQLNDGENEFNPEHCFGIRDLDGRRKPVADAIEEHIKGARA